MLKAKNPLLPSYTYCEILLGEDMCPDLASRIGNFNKYLFLQFSIYSLGRGKEASQSACIVPRPGSDEA